MDEEGRSSVWTIDRENVITSVGGDWDAFATGNEAASLCGTSVVGRSLFEFIDGEETQRIYRLLLRRVRALDAPILVPFRCDSPELRRHMRLEIEPLRERAIEFRGVFVAAERRPLLRLVARNASRSEALLVSCSFCLRIRLAGDEWVEAEDAVVRLGLLARERIPRLAHGVCPACKARLYDRKNDVGEPPATS
jgi:hypothetical protein